MEQAKWYRIKIHYPSCYEWKEYFRQRFKYFTFIQCLKDSGLKRARLYDDYAIMLYCGKKKLKKLIEEAHLLGLEDELLIFERK